MLGFAVVGLLALTMPLSPGVDGHTLSLGLQSGVSRVPCLCANDSMADGQSNMATHARSHGTLARSRGTRSQPSTQSQPGTQPEADDATGDPIHILVYSRTAGFRHTSIPDGIEAIEALGEAHGYVVDATEDPAEFTDETLDQYAVVVFLSTTGDILDDDQQAAFERFIAKGRGYVGIHAAADTEYDWPWYGELVGGYFKSHPAIQPADLLVIDRDHPATAHLPEVWRRTDEWYNYRENPRGKVRVLIDLDESSYENGGMQGDHPIAWCHEFGGGRSFYTGGGHTSESFAEPMFLEHISGAIRWAAGIEDATPETESIEEDDAPVVR